MGIVHANLGYVFHEESFKKIIFSGIKIYTALLLEM